MMTLDQLTEMVLHDTGCPPTAPVDLDAVASRLGLTVSVRRIAGARGLLRIESGHPVVVLARGLGLTQSRFTLAHEIAHWVSAAYPAEVRAVWAENGQLRDAERFSDAFAATLLLPAAWTRAFLAENDAHEQSLDLLLRLATAAAVSPHAAIIRASRVAGWRRLLAEVRRAGSSWRVLRTSGYLPTALELCTYFRPQATVSITRTGREPGRDWWTVRGPDWSVAVPGQMQHHGPSALLCFAPRRARAVRTSVEPVPDRSQTSGA